MRYELETAPVWEALEAETECPVCFLVDRRDTAAVASFLRGKVMAPNIRVQVNAHGFCPSHFRALFEAGHRLGLALMTQTYLRETVAELLPRFRKVAEAPRRRVVDTAIAATTSRIDDCLICRTITDADARYRFTVVTLWRKDPAFRKVVEAGRGFCFSHTAGLIDMAHDQLGGSELELFLKLLVDLTERAIDRLDRELEWFTKKYDYRNAGASWGTSRDAPARTLAKLTGVHYRLSEGPSTDASREPASETTERPNSS